MPRNAFNQALRLLPNPQPRLNQKVYCEHVLFPLLVAAAEHSRSGWDVGRVPWGLSAAQLARGASLPENETPGLAASRAPTLGGALKPPWEGETRIHLCFTSGETEALGDDRLALRSPGNGKGPRLQSRLFL